MEEVGMGDRFSFSNPNRFSFPSNTQVQQLIDEAVNKKVKPIIENLIKLNFNSAKGTDIVEEVKSGKDKVCQDHRRSKNPHDRHGRPGYTQ